MSKELTPSEFTFHSFRHSQGTLWPQLYIFRYFDLKFGIRPDLHPSALDRQRYLKFIGGTSTKTHIQYDEQWADTADGKIISAFKNLRAFKNAPKTKRHLNLFSAETIALGLAGSLAQRELTILGTDQQWPSKTGKLNREGQARLQQRLATGQASFVHYHGRDGHSTGIEQFDTMYSDMWTEITAVAGYSPDYRSLLEDLDCAVFDAQHSVQAASEQSITL